jgi:hypothetical protein
MKLILTHCIRFSVNWVSLRGFFFIIRLPSNRRDDRPLEPRVHVSHAQSLDRSGPVLCGLRFFCSLPGILSRDISRCISSTFLFSTLLHSWLLRAKAGGSLRLGSQRLASHRLPRLLTWDSAHLPRVHSLLSCSLLASPR